MAAVVTETRALRVLAVSDVSPRQISGGGERILWEHATRLARAGHQVRILSRTSDDGRSAAWERQGVSIGHFSADRRSLVHFVRSSIAEAGRAATRELCGAAPDLLHLHQPLSGYGVLRLPAARTLPSLYTFLSPAPLEYRSRRRMTHLHRGGAVGVAGVALLWFIERACLQAATRIHVLSEFSAGQLSRLYRIAPERIVRIPGGVDTAWFRPPRSRGEVRAALGLPPDRPVLLTVRNLEARMGLDTLLEALALLRRDVPGVLLLVGGSGWLRPHLERLTASLGLEGHVRFLGFVPEVDLPAHYQAADFFVLPTRELEGFGLVTVESLACGTPVLGTPVGATPEILRGVGAEYIFDGTDAGAIAAGMRQQLARLADREGYEASRRACAEYALARFAWDGVVARLEEEMRALVSERKEGRP